MSRASQGGTHLSPRFFGIESQGGDQGSQGGDQGGTTPSGGDIWDTADETMVVNGDPSRTRSGGNGEIQLALAPAIPAIVIYGPPAAAALYGAWQTYQMSVDEAGKRRSPREVNKPGRKKQGRESGEKKRQKPGWKPRNPPKEPPKHTPSRKN